MSSVPCNLEKLNEVSTRQVEHSSCSWRDAPLCDLVEDMHTATCVVCDNRPPSVGDSGVCSKRGSRQGPPLLHDFRFFWTTRRESENLDNLCTKHDNLVNIADGKTEFTLELQGLGVRKQCCGLWHQERRADCIVTNSGKSARVASRNKHVGTIGTKTHNTRGRRCSEGGPSTGWHASVEPFAFWARCFPVFQASKRFFLGVLFDEKCLPL